MNRVLLAAWWWNVVAGACSLQAADEPQNPSLRVGQQTLLVYNAEFQASPDATKPYFGRSGFIHPVYTPQGRVVTDAFPADHLHQHGLMFAWTSAVIDGRKVDFWNSAKQTGHVEHVKTVHADDNRIVVQLQHVDDTVEPPGVAIREVWEITRVPHDSMHIFDLVSTQTCASPTAVQQKTYHYGAMCVRGAADWMKQGAEILTSEGKGRVEGNHTRPQWVVMSGKVGGELCGIAAMSHPDNFRAPQPVRLHPNKPYFCFAPMVLGDFTMEPGKPYVSRFRFVAFDGPAAAVDLNRLMKEFAGRKAL